MKEIRTLTGLRGIAAIWVVALHYTAGAGWTGPGFWFRLAAAGMEGVIIFFLLSGYILSQVYGAKALHSYGSFMWARFARVYPLHFATLLAWGAVLWFGFFPQNPDDNWFTFGLNVLLVQAWGFWDTLSWNRLSWTISIELFCYLLFPFAAYWMTRRSILLCAAIGVICLLSVAYVPYDHLLHALGLQRDMPLKYGFYVFHFSGLFLAGMALQRVTSWLRVVISYQRVFDAILAAGLAIVVYKGSHPPVFDWSIAIGAALIIVGLASDDGLGAVLFGNPIVFFLGEISYALYLTHGMVHVVLEHYSPDAPIYVAVIFAIALAASIYYLLERPARKLIRGLVDRPKPVALKVSPPLM